MNKPILIVGPCVIESRENILATAEELNKISKELDIEIIFKSSFDKANRSSIESYRGPGIDEGLAILKEVKDKYGFRILTDVHEVWQVEKVKDIIDIIQIPAFLSRQTDLVVAAGESGLIVNIKKGQFLAPWDVINIVEKIKSTGNDKILITERGTSFGYNRLIVDYTGIIELKKLGYPVIFDATHSVQQPGGLGKSSGGNVEYVQKLAKAAISVGVDGIFMEAHLNPTEALSDGKNMVRIDELKARLTELINLYNYINLEA